MYSCLHNPFCKQAQWQVGERKGEQEIEPNQTTSIAGGDFSYAELTQCSLSISFFTKDLAPSPTPCLQMQLNLLQQKKND